MPKANSETIEDRKFFTKIHEAIPLPNLIEVQRSSYDWFIQQGLRDLFDEINPISDFTGRELEVHFLDYYLDEPRYDERFAKEKNLTYEAAIRVKAKLLNKRTGSSRTQEVYLGEFPIMTDRGTFIVNGIERVVVSQLIRSAGVFFTSNILRGRRCYGAKIIPNRGAWLEIETEASNVIVVKIDRKRKVPITSFLRAIGYSSDEEILELFRDIDTAQDARYIQATLEKDTAHSEPDASGRSGF